MSIHMNDGSTMRNVVGAYVNIDGQVRTIVSGWTNKNGVVTKIFELNTINLDDFEYTKNADGTYTITGWKGTLNGVASTELVVPDNELIII